MAWNEPGGSGRDPWNPPPGGKPGGGGGPDLDAMLRKLRGMLGFKGGAGGGAPRGSQRGLIGAGIAALAVLWLLSGFYSVDEQERAIVLRFGAYAGTTSQGVHWHLPLPIEKVEKIRVTNIRAVSSHSVLLTEDENIVDVKLTVQFRVSSPEQFAFNVQDPDKTVQQVLDSVVRGVVGHSSMDEVLRSGRQAIGITIRQRLQEQLDSYSTGLLVTEVNLQEVEPPDEVQAAFADAIKAREDRARMIAEGEAYAKDRLPRARAEADSKRTEAAAYRDQAVAHAEGDVARFDALLEQYRKAPQVTRDRMYIDAMRDVLAKTAKVVVDVDHGNPNLNIPIEQLLKLRESGGQSAEATDSSSSGSASGSSSSHAPPAAGSGGGTTQDGMRSRDRGSH